MATTNIGRESELHSRLGARVHADMLEAIIIGAGFGGLGMAHSLKRRGINRFVILEKARTVGGVWRDNVYPGAACDVPSHLYSFSFAPNPNWSRTFAVQSEIHAYLEQCADVLGIRDHVRFGMEVRSASYDERADCWMVRLADGQSLSARLLISAVGQLSRPAFPRIQGSENVQIPVFHSATWDHSIPLEGKRVGVIGTGASAIQFVPAIADTVGEMTVFQRSAAYILPKPDRAYSARERQRFAKSPFAMKLHRLQIYLRYEARALAFTRVKQLMEVAAGWPFRRMLKRTVKDPALRAKLTPDYPIGCKRLLLSNDYLPTMARPNVALVTEGIHRLTPRGVETADGKQREFDVLIYGTGFAATEFLSPMEITGRDGVDLNDAWGAGASAYLGMSVPGFPNFFMLYGPNTNLGHNSIVYMLESQIAHIMRCIDRMTAAGASRIEIGNDVFEKQDARIQMRLAQTVWNGCKSWYVNEQGRNTTNWPGFTLSYGWLTRRLSLDAYRFSRSSDSVDGAQVILPPQDLAERINAVALRGFLRSVFRTLIGPPFPASFQRVVVSVLATSMPGVAGVAERRADIGTLRVDVLTPREADGATAQGAMLYLHGGAFCLGNARSHRSVTTRLAEAAGMAVWVPDYRLAPEHPYPAGLEDALSTWQAMRRAGHRAEDIVIAGDSAGGSLALALAIMLRDEGKERAGGLVLFSPVTDPALGGGAAKVDDPMIRRGWLAQALKWYRLPAEVLVQRPLQAALDGLPPMLIQVGDQEILLSDATRLAEQARRQGVDCRLEIHAQRWHVFHLQATYLSSARRTLAAAGAFARCCVKTGSRRATLSGSEDRARKSVDA
ncbi:alpha/beta hydrolase fold domain-containing protein [Rhizobium sp. C1]|uniref:alpha/beta hydrolase fold domain-containing protein n=1 Tax=Rhizobium sp. C1 TaxID=1349799 RepID=UPI001E3B482E|nr:alpha/beta hydrolase fold domain-containing protein [Rhizobium sp. C1]MCD2179319.1 alpha/beta hydrolase fold domain-containing protein [Rhizobium sp. C1]